MRNFELGEKDPLKCLIRESGPESPKAGFHMNILNKLSTQACAKPYEPVISSFAMKIIGGLLVAFFISVLLFVPSSESNLSFWNQLPQFTFLKLNLPIPDLPIPRIELGPIFNFSIAIFSLMAFSFALLSTRKWRYQ